MQENHPVDALLFLALAISSKRRPADLLGIVAAVDLIQGAQGIVPSQSALSEAFHRLSVHGLIAALDEGFALTPKAQRILTSLPRKAEPLERMTTLRNTLLTCAPTGEHEAIVINGNQLGAAILAHQNAGKNAGRNMLVPKPRPTEGNNRPGLRQRKPLPARRKD